MSSTDLIGHYESAVARAREFLAAIPPAQLLDTDPKALMDEMRSGFRLPLMNKDPERGVKVRKPGKDERIDYEIRYYIASPHPLGRLAEEKEIPRPTRWTTLTVEKEILFKLLRIDPGTGSFHISFDGSVEFAKELVSFVDSYVAAINEDIYLVNRECFEAIERVLHHFYKVVRDAAAHEAKRAQELKDAGFDIE